MTNNAATSSETPGVKPRRRWLWVFAALGVLGLLAIGINFGYNQRQQLTDDQLQAARRRWDQAGLRDYDLRVHFKRQSSSPGDAMVIDRFDLRVRNGTVESAAVNGEPLEPRLHAEYDMHGLFDSIEEFLRRDRLPGQPQTFLKATFDRQDGHLLQFIRRVRRSSERQEIVVVLERR